MDLQLLALIVLAILCVLQWRHSASRMQEMERKIAELAEVKDDLQRLLAKQGQQTASAPETAAPQPAQEEDAPKEEPVPTHAVAAHQSVVPVGQRQPAVVAARPMATVPAEPTAPQADVSDISPEVVAVIMAASLLTIIWILGLMDASIKGNEAWQVIGLDGLARFVGGFSGTPVIAAILWALAAGLFALEKKRGVTGRTSSAGKTGDLAGKWPRRIWAAVVILTVVVILAVLYDANVAGHGERYGVAANYLIFNDSWGTDRGFA